MPLHDMPYRYRALGILTTMRRYLTNPYVWAGLVGIGMISAVMYLVLNLWVMPSFTRHDASITVPDVINLSEEAATASLEAEALSAETVILRKPNLPRNVVIDQNPPPLAEVKPGRRVYLTINTGDTTTVVVPKVESYGIRQARNMLMQADLVVGEVSPDSIPSVYKDIITKQDPSPGQRVSPGTTVHLLFGTGLGTTNVLVPDVSGMNPEKARRTLLDVRLRSVVMDESSGSDSLRVISQAPPAGTSVREGYEVRLFLRQPESGPTEQ
jgi:beta-lactam-binding protein with PASTA domain